MESRGRQKFHKLENGLLRQGGLSRGCRSRSGFQTRFIVFVPPKKADFGRNHARYMKLVSSDGALYTEHIGTTFTVKPEILME